MQRATSLWGGMYFPLVPLDDYETAHKLAVRMGIDAIVMLDPPVGGAGLVDLPGRRWRGAPQYGPFDNDDRDRILSPAPLDVGAILQGLHRIEPKPDLMLPEWSEEDVLDDIFGVWWGRYGASKAESTIRDAYKLRAGTLAVTDGPLPNFGEYTTPVEFTTIDIELMSESDVGILLMDPTDPVDLIHLWNLRSNGATVFPWLPNVEGMREQLDAWLERQPRVELPRRNAPPEQEPKRSIFVWSRKDNEIPTAVTDALTSASLDVFPAESTLRPFGWRGNHPFHTHYSASFSLSVDLDEGLRVPLPSIDFLPRRSDIYGVGGVRGQARSAGSGRRAGVSVAGTDPGRARGGAESRSI